MNAWLKLLKYITLHNLLNWLHQCVLLTLIIIPKKQYKIQWIFRIFTQLLNWMTVKTLLRNLQREQRTLVTCFKKIFKAFASSLHKEILIVKLRMMSRLAFYFMSIKSTAEKVKLNNKTIKNCKKKWSYLVHLVVELAH